VGRERRERALHHLRRPVAPATDMGNKRDTPPIGANSTPPGSADATSLLCSLLQRALRVHGRVATLRMGDRLLDVLEGRVATYLATDTRRSWPLIHTCRLEQRIIFCTMIELSERRGYRNLRRFTIFNWKQVVAAAQGEIGGIYVRVSRQAHRWRYVGQTQ
jgi:hypothetical protein